MIGRWLAGGLTALVVILVMAAVSGATAELTKDELKALLGSPDIAIIDVRSDCPVMRIPGALCESPVEVQKWAPMFSTDQMIVVYCA